MKGIQPFVCCLMCYLSLQQFERLFQFAKKIEDLMYTISPEEVSYYH